MELQRQVAMKKDGKTYYKRVVAIPFEAITTLGWNNGIDLTAETRQDRLVLRPSSD